MSVRKAKSIPPLAPAANGGLTRGSDLPIHLPPAFCKNTVQICRGNFQGTGKLGRHHQSLKHRYTQSSTRAAHHSEGVSSLGIFRVFALMGSSLDPGRRWVRDLGISWTLLAHGTHSFPVITLYNIFRKLSRVLCNFHIFNKQELSIICIMHNPRFLSAAAPPSSVETRENGEY